MAYRYKSFEEGSFLKDVAMSKNYPYLALGNRFIMSMVREAAKSSVSVLKHKRLKGLLLVYMLTIKDFKGRERACKLVSFLVNEQVSEIDARSIWDFEYTDDKPKIETSKLLDSINIVKYQYVTSILDRLHEDTRKRLDNIKNKTVEVATNHFSTKISELNNNIEEYKGKLLESPHFANLIKKEESKISKLKGELENRLKSIEEEFKTYPIVELIGIAEVISEEDYDARREVELAGMEKVMEYERRRASDEDERARIRDVSNMLRGYDIESFDRVIEAKLFKESGAIELTSHEWSIANKMRDGYWLYVVEDALGEGRITLIQDPVERFKDLAKKEPTIDYRYIIENWKESV